MKATALARRAGPDRCPGVHSVWSAADGGLARVRIPGGRLTVAQWRLLAEAAQELGNGVLELTVRANVQLRGLRPGGETELAARLRAGGLLPSDTHDRVRNILASPLTGLPGRGDVGELVVALDSELCARPALAELPGRFLFALDDGAGDVGALDPDVGVIAAGDSCALLLGGGLPGRWVSREEAVPVLLAAAAAFLAERAAQHSAAWRLAELADGPSRVLARIVQGIALREAGPQPPAVDSPHIPTGLVRTGEDFAAVVEIPDGRCDAGTARALADAADPTADLRVTPWRSIVLPGRCEPAARACLSLASEEGRAIALPSSDVTSERGAQETVRASGRATR